jgi:hypothetical protein
MRDYISRPRIKELLCNNMNPQGKPFDREICNKTVERSEIIIYRLPSVPCGIAFGCKKHQSHKWILSYCPGIGSLVIYGSKPFSLYYKHLLVSA